MSAGEIVPRLLPARQGKGVPTVVGAASRISSGLAQELLPAHQAKGASAIIK
jgi:hypothetical protein